MAARLTTLVVVAIVAATLIAGLIVGAAAERLDLRVVGASVSRPPDEIRARIASIAAECARLLGAPGPDPSTIHLVDARGPGYGVASEEGMRAARLAADTEGLLLDHVFTADHVSFHTGLGMDGLVRAATIAYMVFIAAKIAPIDFAMARKFPRKTNSPADFVCEA